MIIYELLWFGTNTAAFVRIPLQALALLGASTRFGSFRIFQRNCIVFCTCTILFEIISFARRVSQLTEFRSPRWAGTCFSFDSGAAWRSIICSLQHPSCKTSNSATHARDRQSTICIVPCETGTCEFQRIIGDSAGARTRQPPDFKFTSAGTNFADFGRHRAKTQGAPTHDLGSV